MSLGPSYQYRARMVRVIDGDTYEVQVDLGFRIYHAIHVRLRDFNTAELRASDPLEVEHAQRARDFVRTIAPPGTSLILVTAKAAVYNRWEAHVFIEDLQAVSLAELLRDGGFARQASYP